MINEDLLEEMAEKYDARSLGPEDLHNFFKLLCEIGNEHDEIQAEINEPEFQNIKFIFEVEGIENFTLIIEEGKFSFQEGLVDDWGAQLVLDASDLIKLLQGQVDGNNLYMAGQLEAHGGLPRVIKFQTVLEIVQEYLEENY